MQSTKIVLVRLTLDSVIDYCCWSYFALLLICPFAWHMVLPLVTFPEDNWFLPTYIEWILFALKPVVAHYWTWKQKLVGTLCRYSAGCFWQSRNWMRGWRSWSRSSWGGSSWDEATVGRRGISDHFIRCDSCVIDFFCTDLWCSYPQELYQQQRIWDQQTVAGFSSVNINQ